MPVKQIRIGVIGAGRIGGLHCQNLSRFKDVEIVALADPHIGAALPLAASFDIRRAVPDHRVLLEDPGIDALVICSPTDTHLPLVVAAAQAGKHVFCEKPLSFDSEAIKAALKIVARSGVKLQVGFNRRFDPHFVRLQQVVAEGTVGKIQMVHITSRDPAPPPLSYIERSGGLFLDMTIHDFDMLRFIVNDTPTSVFASGAVLVDPAIGAAGDVDSAVSTLRFASGMLAIISNCRQCAFGYDQRIEVFGSLGSIAVGNVSATKHQIGDAKGMHYPCPHYFFTERYADSYVHEMRAFVDAIAKDTAPSPTGEDALLATVIAQAALRSCQEVKQVSIKDNLGPRPAKA